MPAAENLSRIAITIIPTITRNTCYSHRQAGKRYTFLGNNSQRLSKCFIPPHPSKQHFSVPDFHTSPNRVVSRHHLHLVLLVQQIADKARRERLRLLGPV